MKRHPLIERWRATVGRLPKHIEDELHRLVGKHGAPRVIAAVDVVSAAGLRRTRQRVTLLYAYLGEEVPLALDTEDGT